MARKWWTLLVVCAGTFMLLLDTTIVYVALPAIQRGLHAGFSDVQWVIDAYSLALAALLLTAGTLADRFGRRRLYALGMIVFTIGSLLCGLAQSPLMLTCSRAFQGIGGSVMFATGLALIAGSFEGRQRGTAFGIWGMVTGIASALGPILGGAITSGISWRGIFLVNVPIGVVAVVIGTLRVDEAKSPRPRRIDVPGLVLWTAGMISLIYGLIRAGETAWSSAGAIGWLTGGGVGLIAFLVVEARSKEPMFDLRLFRIPTFVGGAVAAFSMNGSMFSMFLFLAAYLQDVLGYSPLQAGVRLLIPSAAMLVSSIVAGQLSGRVPVRVLIGAGLVAVGAGLLLMGGLTTTTGWTHLIPGFVVAGLGAGLVNPPLASTAVGVVEMSRSGMASGVNSTFRQVGMSTSIAVLGSIFATIIGNRLGSGLAGLPLPAGRTSQLAAQVRAGDISEAVATTPAQIHGQVRHLAESGFVSGINTLLVVTGVIALAGGILAALLIRTRDFLASQPRPAADPTSPPRQAKPAVVTDRMNAGPG